jgi:hypothetical protein
MNGIGNFFWLWLQALMAGPILFPVITLLAAVGLLTAVRSALANRERFLHRRSLWLLAPFLIPNLIVLYGVVFVYDGPVWSAPAWRGQVIYALLWSHVPIAGLLLWRLRTIWVVVLGLSVVQAWLSFCTGFMAYMSVTNVWL